MKPTIRRLAALAALALCSALAAAPAAGQSGALRGRVVTGAGAPVPGALVTLHLVTRTSQGAVDSTRTGADGAFRLPLPPAPADTTGGFTVLFTTAEAYGVRYFGAPLHGGTAAADTGAPYTVTVYDTASAPALADSLRVVRRDYFFLPGTSGGFEVAEVVRVRNPATRTLVPQDGKPLFGVHLPSGAQTFEAFSGSGDTARVEDVIRMGDRVWMTAPVIPGERDFYFRYRLSPTGRKVVLPAAQPIDTLNVYVRQPAPEIETANLPAPTEFEGEGEKFLRWTRLSPTADAPAELRWSIPGAPPVDPRWVGLGVAAAVLAAGTALALRRRGPSAPA